MQKYYIRPTTQGRGSYVVPTKQGRGSYVVPTHVPSDQGRFVNRFHQNKICDSCGTLGHIARYCTSILTNSSAEAHEEELAKEREAHEDELAKECEDHQATLANERRAHQATLANERRAHQATLANERQAHEATLAKECEAHEATLAKEREAHEAILANERLAHEAILANERQSHQAILANERQAIEDEVDEILTIKRALERKEEDMSEVEAKEWKSPYNSVSYCTDPHCLDCGHESVVFEKSKLVKNVFILKGFRPCNFGQNYGRTELCSYDKYREAMKKINFEKLKNKMGAQDCSYLGTAYKEETKSDSYFHEPYQYSQGYYLFKNNVTKERLEVAIVN